MTIQVENLSKDYDGNKVLCGLNLDVEAGEFFGLLGPNGSGKTTLISILTGIISSSSGRVFVCGEKLDGQHIKYKDKIGLAPQVAALYSTLSLWENLEFFGSMQGLRGKALESQIQFCAKVVQLEDFYEQPVSSFSGGMRQRANIAVSIIHRPKVLFLDEPTVGVDPQSRNMIFECLREFNRQGMTIIYTTHYMEEAEQLCSRIGILDHGKIIAQGGVKDLMKEHQCQNLGDMFLKLTGKALRD